MTAVIPAPTISQAEFGMTLPLHELNTREDYVPRHLRPSETADYDLSGIRADYRTRSFLEANPGDGRYFCAVVEDGSPMANVARKVEREVFEEKFGNDSKRMAEIYGPYEEASTFLVVFDRQNERAIGTVRLVWDSPAGNMTLSEPWRYGCTETEINQRYGLDDPDARARTFDIGTLAVLPEYRGKLSGLKASTLLYRTVFLEGSRRGMRMATAIIDPAARRNSDLLGIPFENICDSEPFDFEGSKGSMAIIGDFTNFEASVVGKANALRDRARTHIGDLLTLNIKRIVFWKLAARTAGELATGRDLDSHISLRT
jgi:hypothetical protein